MRGEVGETYWGGACDFFCIFGFRAFRDESTEKKIVGLVRVMRGGWSVESYERWVTSETQVQRIELLLVGWELWEVGEFNISGVRVGWVLRHEGEHREERRDEIVQRRGDKIKKKKKKKSWSAVGPSAEKSWVNVLVFITNLPSETCVQCLKSPLPTF